MYQVSYLKKHKNSNRKYHNKFLCVERVYCVIESKLIANIIAYLIDGWVTELKDNEIESEVELGKELEDCLPTS